ncbi:MAG: hypothetical protein CTY36_10005 [Methylocystis sp.]|nr:MAG: hypothetical protein CTY36_10005 [Methylocystis sp.]
MRPQAVARGREEEMTKGMKRKIVMAVAMVGGLAAVTLAASAENAAPIKDPEIERTRQHIKMLDDVFKTAVVLIDETYVKHPSDPSAASAAKALFAAMKKNGWYDVRLIGLTDKVGDPDDEPKDAFEKTAAKRLRGGGEQAYEEIMEKDGKRYLRMATGIPVVSENCVMCHAHFKGDKGNIGALSYTMPVVK